jgi:hypothetical protein
MWQKFAGTSAEQTFNTEVKHMATAKKSELKKIGRPAEPVPADKAEEIIDWISQGKTLREWCRNNEIHYSTVYLWMGKDKEFAQRFAHARDIGHDVIADETFDIIDSIPPSDANGKTDSGYVAWAKNRVELRLKLLAKWNPKKYGDKMINEHTGADGGAIQIDDTERAAKLKAILTAAQARKNAG